MKYEPNESTLLRTVLAVTVLGLGAAVLLGHLLAAAQRIVAVLP